VNLKKKTAEKLFCSLLLYTIVSYLYTVPHLRPTMLKGATGLLAEIGLYIAIIVCFRSLDVVSNSALTTRSTDCRVVVAGFMAYQLTVVEVLITTVIPV
jgi:hypothetical protein